MRKGSRLCGERKIATGAPVVLRKIVVEVKVGVELGNERIFFSKTTYLMLKIVLYIKKKVKHFV